jgi:hypothetical protein
VFTRDTAICAYCPAADLSYTLPAKIKNQKDIYQMTTTEMKEELLNQVYNRMAWNPEPEIMEAATKNIALYIVDLLLVERQVISEVLKIPADSYWKLVRDEIAGNFIVNNFEGGNSELKEM